MPEREGPSFTEKAVRYPTSALFFLAALGNLVHLNVVVAAAEGLISYIVWPKQKRSPQAA